MLLNSAIERARMVIRIGTMALCERSVQRYR